MVSLTTKASGDINSSPFGSPGEAVMREAIHLRNLMKVGTWNVRGLLQTGKLHIVEDEMYRLGLPILGIAETHWKGTGHFISKNNNMVFYSGNDTTSRNGVGFIISQKLSKCIMGYKTYSDRIISIKIHANPCNLNIVQAYAPTSTANDEEIENFYNGLDKVISEIPQREILMTIGDFNAKIGDTTNDDHAREILGKYGIGIRDERGERLIQFCMENHFTITNTLYQHHIRRLYTWQHPDLKHRNQIDYILLNSRWRTMIKNVKTYPGAECGSDHQLLIAKIQLKLRCNKIKKATRKINITDKDKFKNNISTIITTHELKKDDPDVAWGKIKMAIAGAARDLQKDSTNTPRQIWMSNNTLKMVEERRKLKCSGLNTTQKKNLYKQLSGNIQRACRRDKNEYYREICMEIQNHAEKNDPKELYKAIKHITRQFKPQTWAIQNREGKTVTEINEIIEVWRVYCGKLFEDDGPKNNEQVAFLPEEKEPDIMKEEIESAIKHLKAGKATANDGINAEAIKAMEELGINLIHALCQKIWHTGIWPNDWCNSIFIPIHKKGSKEKCDNYRLIALIPHTSKILLHIINERLKSYLTWQIPKEQTGFVKGKGTREQILNIRQIIEKAREFNKQLYICFIDYKKAFDSVRWDKLWLILSEMGVPKHLIHLIQELYSKADGRVKVDQQVSKQFTIEKGVRQGCILSPLLFNIYGEYIMRRVLENEQTGIKIDGERISNLRYADDTAIFATTEEGITEFIQRVKDISAAYGLELNKEKTKILIIDRANNNRPDVKQIADYEVVNHYIYLGSYISNEGGCTVEIKRRIQMTKGAMTKLNRIWKDHQITKNTKMQLVKALVYPILLYGAEAWTLKESERRRIDACEMWCWRRMLRIPWTDKRTNISILAELNVTQRLSSTIYKHILKYFGHISRSDSSSLEKLIIHGRVEGSRPRGRSPKRWLDQVKAIIGKPLQQITHDAYDRAKWKEVVHTAVDSIL